MRSDIRSGRANQRLGTSCLDDLPSTVCAVDVLVYDATGSFPLHGPLADKPSVLVEAVEESSTTEVVNAAGFMAYSSFALVTPEVEADVSAGQPESVSYVDTLVGVNEQGELYYPRGRQVPWADFLRAVNEGFFTGDASRIVVYPYGVAGGWAADGVWPAVNYLFRTPGGRRSDMGDRG